MSHMAILFLRLIAPGLAMLWALLELETRGANLLGWYLLLMGVAGCAGAVILYWVRKEPASRPAGDEIRIEEAGDRSIWLIVPGILIAFLAPPLELLYFSGMLPRTLLMQAAGINLALVGTILAAWAVMVVPGSFAARAGARTVRQLPRNGPYRLVRHPACSGCLFIALGICVGYSSLNGLLAIAVLLLPGFVFRIQREERSMAKHFGKQFREYRAATARLIPGIW